jgi:ATP/maltotriose-dependent transcriptional regulator MalT
LLRQVEAAGGTLTVPAHMRPVLGCGGTVPLGAAGAFVVTLAARVSWFCSHQVFAVLLRLGRRRTGLAEKAALGRAFSWARALRVLRHAASRLCAGLRPGRAG